MVKTNLISLPYSQMFFFFRFLRSPAPVFRFFPPCLTSLQYRQWSMVKMWTDFYSLNCFTWQITNTFSFHTLSRSLTGSTMANKVCWSIGYRTTHATQSCRVRAVETLFICSITLLWPTQSFIPPGSNIELKYYFRTSLWWKMCASVRCQATLYDLNEKWFPIAVRSY